MFVWLPKILCQTFIAFDHNKIIYDKKKNFARRHFCLQTVFIYQCHMIWWSVHSFRASFARISFHVFI